jgi:hypothetical protein
MARESGGGPPHSKTLARVLAAQAKREAFWSAPELSGAFGRPAIWQCAFIYVAVYKMAE